MTGTDERLRQVRLLWLRGAVIGAFGIVLNVWFMVALEALWLLMMVALAVIERWVAPRYQQAPDARHPGSDRRMAE